MITDINNEPITPGRYRYRLDGWRTSTTTTVEERDGVLYIRSNADVYPTMKLKYIRRDAIMERIED